MKHTYSISLTCIIILLGITSCNSYRFTTASGLSPKDFRQKVEGQKTGLYKIANRNGMEACITNYGAGKKWKGKRPAYIR